MDADQNDSGFIIIKQNQYTKARYGGRKNEEDPCKCRPQDRCGQQCLNRITLFECGRNCPSGDFCENKSFQRRDYAAVEIFEADRKGRGVRLLKEIPKGSFIVEYVGEVLDEAELQIRMERLQNRKHFYFMKLDKDSFIDSTFRGNWSRYINHGCQPNCEVQKWMVNGKTRLGVFANTDLKIGDEIVYDYQFERYGTESQSCFCGASCCTGWIGRRIEGNSKRKGALESVEDEYAEVFRNPGRSSSDHTIHLENEENRPLTYKTCRFCEKSFSRASDTLRHEQEKHVNPQQHKCEDCKTTFLAKRTLQTHKKRCTSSRRKAII